MSQNENKNQNKNEHHLKYAIFQCSHCKRWLYARAVQKTSKCGYCQKINPIPETPQYSTEKPTTALTKIKELNAKNPQIPISEPEFQSKGKYKPVIRSRISNTAVKKPKNIITKESNSQALNIDISESKLLNKKTETDEIAKAANALKNFQIEKRIEPTQGIPLTLVPLILKNAGIISSKSQNIIQKLLHRGILQYTENKSAVFVV